MARILWFTVGFVAAVALVAALVLGPLMDIRASGTVTPVAPPTRALTESATPAPTEPAVALPLLTWQREGGVSGLFQSLEVPDLNQVRYTPDRAGPRVSALTQAERETLNLYLVRYAPFDYAVQESLDGFSQVAVRLRLNGQGKLAANETDRAEVARWAATVLERLAEEERRADLVARARLDLAQRTGLSVEQIVPLAIAQVTWPNACLDIHEAGVSCALVATPGYQFQFQAGSAVYEYRSDLHGLVRLASQTLASTTGQ